MVNQSFFTTDTLHHKNNSTQSEVLLSLMICPLMQQGVFSIQPSHQSLQIVFQSDQCVPEYPNDVYSVNVFSSWSSRWQFYWK